MTKEKTCDYKECGISMKEMLVTIDDGNELIALCPNHAAMYSIEDKIKDDIITHPSELKQPLTVCHACNEKSDVLYQTMNYGGELLSIELCHEDESRLLDLNLTPSGYLKIREKFGIFHEIHDDFYDEEGYAFQPRV